MRRRRLIGGISLVFFVAICSVSPIRAQTSEHRYKAVAFDYFVIFDPNSVVTEVENVFPGKGMDFTKAWRAKQFEYGFLRSITKNHEDFFKVTEDALLYTMESMKLEATKDQKRKLLNHWC